MARIADRLKELGIELPPVAKPVAAYIPAIRTGNLVMTSGQIPTRSGELVAKGLVGADLTTADGAAAARVAMLNALAAVNSLVPLDDVKRVVRVVCYVAGPAGFTEHPKVANGASELLQEIFGEAGRHVRSAVGASALPLGAPVEVELVVEV